MSVPTKHHWRMEVEWVDSTLTHQEGWLPIRSVLARRKRRDAVRCLSVGFVLADDDDGIVLAATVHGNEVAGITHIPTGAIVSRTRLAKPVENDSDRWQMVEVDGGYLIQEVDSGRMLTETPMGEREALRLCGAYNLAAHRSMMLAKPVETTGDLPE